MGKRFLGELGMAVSARRKARSGGVAGVSMAPMIDMVFLLLVFFMTASAMSQDGSKLELELPESEKAVVAQDFSGRLIVSIDGSGQAYLGGIAIGREELQERFQAFREQQSGGKLTIRAAGGTPFSAVKVVMRLAAQAGIGDYLYATYQGSGS